jgi:IMP cyclohydrolase
MSSTGLNILEKMEYPGRIIIIGRDTAGENDVVVYAITGRSPASRARRLAWDGGETVRTEVTDPDQLNRGNEKLLIYNCVRAFPDGLAVSNGAQTDLIWETAHRLIHEKASPDALEVLNIAFNRPHQLSGMDLTSYEPDAPVFTPRIGGCITRNAALSIIRRLPDGSPDRAHFQVPWHPGRGRLLATYAGQNRDPLPSFRGVPADVELIGTTVEELSETVYAVLGPGNSAVDLRVGVAVLFRNCLTGALSLSIINRAERGR